MKQFAIILFGIVCTIQLRSQTKEADYNYIINHYVNQENSDIYKSRELTQSDLPRGNDLKATLQFVMFSKEEKDIGIAVVYRETNRSNELLKIIVLCIPLAGSEDPIVNRSLTSIKDIDDVFALKYILMGLTRICVRK